jgi:acetyl-CoA C-acetyltransferase
MPEAVIVDAIRTPIGRAVKGSLKTVRADDLAAIPLRTLIERNPALEQTSIGDVMMGCGYGEGESGYNIGRIASLLAGIDHHVPACTVNRFCASSLQTTRMAFHAIKAGEGDTYIAAGVEAVSRTGRGSQFEFNHAVDGSEGSAYNVYIPMGMTAENVAERCNVSREAQDEWALISQTRAVAAVESGHFDSEIVPVTVPAHKDVDKEGNEIDVPETVVTKDDGPRPGTTMERLAALKPVFKEGGSVTAGNSCPEVMGLGPIPAIQKLLAATGMKIEDIDVVEINEAFAAQIVPCIEELGLDREKLNPFGGAIALGHPFGMTGARIMTTLLNDLETLDGTYGVESMCVAGGMGMAMLVERLS